MDRRHFLKDIAVSGTVVWSPLKLGASQTTAVSRPTLGYRFFTLEQVVTAGAVCEQIVPPDDYPGAKQAGVVQFIDGVLARPIGRFYRMHYQQGLSMINNVSSRRHGKNFALLRWEDQTSILRDFESGVGAGPVGKKFFLLIVRHTMEGYYGDPSHGGNRKGLSWKMINFGG
ncbi:MAG TPA: gluconate 2-dehydrogenase subunit 3 family protein [Terriglobia bacterium]|nr:gluconate 2-dehydrogenase subunit 3 family protein [Terriglobia bacterium]